VALQRVAPSPQATRFFSLASLRVHGHDSAICFWTAIQGTSPRAHNTHPQPWALGPPVIQVPQLTHSTPASHSSGGIETAVTAPHEGHRTFETVFNSAMILIFDY